VSAPLPSPLPPGERGANRVAGFGGWSPSPLEGEGWGEGRMPKAFLFPFWLSEWRYGKSEQSGLAV
jgi:hypothetical protein